MSETMPQLSVGHLLEELIKCVYWNVQSTVSKESENVRSYLEIASWEQSKTKNHQPNEKFLKKCKTRAYEILLKKRRNNQRDHDECADEGYSENIDPFLEIRVCQFKLNLMLGQTRKLPYVYHYEALKKYLLHKQQMFDASIDFICTDTYFQGEHSDGHAILHLLILLKDSVPDQPPNENFFALSKLSTNMLPKIETNYFQINWPENNIYTNPYISDNVRKITYFPVRNQDNGENFSVQRIMKVICEKAEKREPVPIMLMSNKWEYLGQKYVLNHRKIEIPKEKRFTSECSNAAMHILAKKEISNRRNFEAKIISIQKFVEHVRALLVGIESESFLFNQENNTFAMVDDLTVENVLPATMENYVKEFLECGACYKRLKMLISKNLHNFKFKYDGFLFKAMCNSFNKYLDIFRRLVIFGKNNNLVELYLRVNPLIKQIRVLAHVLAIHPSDQDKEIPRGSEFLGYLYKEIISITQRDVSMLLVFILSECCEVYFRNFENWIFHGSIDDPHHELFIEFINHYRPKTKHYFDKANLIKPYSVPGFLQGWENTTLICGKYANLLKMYNPSHPLLSITPPPLTVCLSFKELEKMEQAWFEYTQCAQELCGSKFVVADVYKRKSEKQKEMVKQVATKCQRDIEQWRKEREVKESVRREQKEADRIILLQQIQENRERKIQKRREHLEEDRQYLRQAEQVELEQVAKENAQKQRNIDYYNELGAIVDAQQKRTENEIKHLKKQLKRTSMQSSANDESIYLSPKTDEDDNSEESVYFDAEKNSPTIPHSSSDILNANTFDLLATDRERNRAHVLTSNIDLNDNDNSPRTQQPSTTTNIVNLTEAQKNKMKILHQEFDLATADANSNEIPMKNLTAELSELQINRNKVLSQEFGMTISQQQTIAKSTDVELTEYGKNRTAAKRNNWTVSNTEGNDLNANEAMTESQQSTSSRISETRAPLRTSLSLDLDDGKSKEDKNEMKTSQSEFALTPMSTTSDGPIGGIDFSPECKEDERKRDKHLKLDLPPNQPNINWNDFTANVLPTPADALNTAGVVNKKNAFNFGPISSAQKKSNYILNPKTSFLSQNIFDISARLIATNSNSNASSIQQFTEPNYEQQNSRSLNDLRSLNVANITEFLQQSFTIPLRAHLELLNNEILKIFFNDIDILGHFVSLRKYFFMMDGEFACNISEGILSKLHLIRKPSELLNSNVLHSILENALHSSIIGNDKNAEKLSFSIPNLPDKFDMASPNMLKDLHLTYQVDWPLNLLLSNETIEHYGNVFQHLLKLRRITWQLDQCFYKLKDVRKQSANMIQRSPQYRHVQQIRHKLLCFVNALQNHITSIALEGSWQNFQKELENIESIEELYRKHVKYLRKVEFLCVLNKSSHEFYAKIEDVFVVILRFCYNLCTNNWRCNNDGIYMHPKYDRLLKCESDFENLIKFIIYLGNKMSKCGYQTEISELIHMININGFYENK